MAPRPSARVAPGEDSPDAAQAAVVPGAPRRLPAGPVDASARRARTMLFNKQLDKNLRVCPTCGHHFRLSADGPPRAAARPRHVRRARRRPRSRSTRSASSTRSRTRTGSRRPRLATGMRDAAVWGTGADRGHAGRASASWTSGSWAARWARSSARRSPAPPSTRSTSACRCIVVARLGRRADAGRHAGADAAGQDVAALERLRGRRRAVHLRPVRPDDRRRLRLVRGARRRQHRRAERAHRLRRRAGRRRARSPRSCRRASSAPSSCSSHGFVDRVVARRGAARRAGRAARPAPSARGSPTRRCRSAADDRRRASGRCRSCSTIADRVGELATGDAIGPRRDGRPTATARPARRSPDGDDVEPRRRSRRRVWARVQLARNLRRPRTLELVGGDGRRLRRAARRPAVRRRPGDRRRLRPARRPAGRRRRPAEGRRHRREHPAQLRHAPSRGLSQGDARHGARRAVRPAGRHLRRRARRAPRARSPRSAASPRRSPARSA